MNRLAVLVALAGCYDHASLALHSAPGNVDLAAPMPHENGDPARFVPPTDPGSEYLSVWTIPYVIGGLGRHDDPNGSGETGIELRFERSRDQLLQASAFAVTLGMGIAQWHGASAEVGPIFGELNHRGLAYVYPIDVGIGPVVYPHDPDVGAQLSVRVAALVVVRTRVLPHTGFEIMAGAEIPFPFFFGRSR